MKVKVMKFGGTSVATPEARLQAAMKVVSAKEQGYAPVVVVSAIGRKGAPYATDTLINLLRDIDPTVDPDDREMDLMIACGEILASVIFAHTLKTLGHPARAFRGGQAGIRTDGVFGNARIVAVNPVALQRTVQDGYIPVVCGFQGVFVPEVGWPGGELTTLGRGGSDTTAAAVGAAMQAAAVEIYTDVDGIKTADPDSVPAAPTLRQVTYEEVAEIAHLGAKVLHPRAAEIAMKYDIPLWVKNTFTEDQGTEIVGQDRIRKDRRVTGVTHSGKLISLQFNLGNAKPEHRIELESRVYEMAARYNLNMVMMNHSPSGMGFAVPRDQFPTIENLLDGLVVPVGEATKSIYLFQIGDVPSQETETQRKYLEPLGEVVTLHVKLTEGCTMVSVVGHEYMRQPGVFLRVFRALEEAQIPILQTSDSDLSLSVLVPESETNRAVRVLHQQFELSGVR